MHTRTTLLLLCLASGPSARAADRVSANYTVASDEINAAGGFQASANYQNHAAAGGLPALAESANLRHRGTHVARLYDVVARELAASPPTLAEEGTRQITPRQILDDDTRLPLDPAAFAWAVTDGPATISAAGLASGLPVYEDTPAEFKASDAEGDLQITLTVLDTLPDNYGMYANDGLPDTWQVFHFGKENPDAAPHLDPDGDHQSNRFEYLAGTAPNDVLSRFRFWIQPHPGTPGQVQLLFSPRLPNRTYHVRWAAQLSGEPVWLLMPSGTLTEDSADVRTVTDLSASGTGMRFYQVRIEFTE